MSRVLLLNIRKAQSHPGCADGLGGEVRPAGCSVGEDGPQDVEDEAKMLLQGPPIGRVAQVKVQEGRCEANELGADWSRARETSCGRCCKLVAPVKTFGISRCPGRSKYVWRKGSSEDCIINKEISDKVTQI